MRILFVQSIGRKKYGGGEKWAVNAASGLQKKGHYVMMAGRKNGILLNEARQRNLPTYHISIYNDINLFQAYRLSRLIKKHNIDIIICKGRELVVSGLAARWAGNTLLIRRSGLPPSKKRKKLVRRTSKFVDGVVTNTNTIREVYQQRGFTGENFVKVIYNGFSPDDSIEAFDFSQTFPGKYIILSAGRLEKRKGYYYLIEALAKIKNTHPQVLAFIMGEGKEKERLKAYAKKLNAEHMIHFAGYIHNVIPYIKGAHLFAHVSLSEGMPNAAMEALAFAKPLILTRVNGADELTGNGKYAELIPAKNATAIADSIKKIITKQKKYEQKATEAQKYVRNKFSMENMVNALEQYLLVKLSEKKNQN